MKHTKMTRFLALFLTVVMIIGLLPFAGFAEVEETTEASGTLDALILDPVAPTLPEMVFEFPPEAGSGQEPESDPSAVQETGSLHAETERKAIPAELSEGLTWSFRTPEAFALSQSEADLSGLLPEFRTEDDPPSLEPITTFADFMSALATLERYAHAYVQEHAAENETALVINFIRCGVEKYTTSTWNTFCGPENTAFSNYVQTQDAAFDTAAYRLRNLDCFSIPNGNVVELAHMFGCLDMAYHTGNQNTADLGSWAGDICDLVQLAHFGGVTGTVEEMAYEIRTRNDTYFLYDNPNSHSFGLMDFYADLDAFYILRNLDADRSISAILSEYYNEKLNGTFRALFFIHNRLDGIRTRAGLRSLVYSIYMANEGIRTLEGSYLPDGVNPDIRMACCYAFADHLYLTAQDRLENPYYTPFSSEKSRIAPGVTQEIKLALTADDKQIVYYVANIDITRPDVSIHANYGENDGSAWMMRRVTDQMKAAERNHCDPDSERYIPNYSAVLGTNADFYNMSTGKPTGALVMEGVAYNGAGSENFFAILDDGTPMIGAPEQWAAVKSRVREAVGCNIMLVQDGQIAVGSNSNYYSSRAPRTCVGITYDGHVVLMVLDGRQEPFSAGGSNIEIAQIMLDAGCVAAANLDGGGSTTFAAKAEGSNEIALVNRPSDGYERSVSSSLLVVSTAKPSNVFDHAVFSTDYDYLTVGTELEVRVNGVTTTGGSIELPEGAVLQVSDPSLGSISENGVFTASALGDAAICLMSEDGAVLGSKTLHIVEPNELEFSRETLNVVLGVPEELPLQAMYNGNEVKINPEDLVFGFVKISLVSIGNIEGGDVNTTKTELVFEYPEAGSIQGFQFTASPESEIRTLTVGAVLRSQFAEFEATFGAEYMRVYQLALQEGYSSAQAEIMAMQAGTNKALAEHTSILLYFYSPEEATFDFDNATGGDGLLSWKRELTNAQYRAEENLYEIVNVHEPMDVCYTFAVDMSKVPIPEKLTALLYMLPGGDQEGRTAWDFLLQLAERISPLTTITVRLQIPEGFTADISDVMLANEYISLSSKELQDNTLTIVCNFIEQTKPIPPTNANPLCVLSGLKLTPTDAAAWDENGRLDVSIQGGLSYDIYAHFHILMNLASQPEFQMLYGLYPYDNRENNPTDYGAHFMNDFLAFQDSFSMNRAGKTGWFQENGGWTYLRNGETLTGVQLLPSHVVGETGEYWYDLGSDGLCSGKITGLFVLEEALYYAVNGERKTGWREIGNGTEEGFFYYFDPDSMQAVDGEQRIKNLTYTFENYILVKGAWVQTPTGKRYYWAGSPIARKWRDIEGKTYYFGYHGDASVGFCMVERGNGNQGADFYLFDADGALVRREGLLFLTEDIPYIYKDFRVGDIVYLNENGMAVYAGLVEHGADLYYINGSLKAVKDGLYWVTKTNGLVVPGLQRRFDPEGKMIIREGIIRLDNGHLVYYIRDDLQYDLGLVMTGDGRFAYVNPDGLLHNNGRRYVGKANGYLPEGYYEFDGDGYMIFDGWVESEEGPAYYEAGLPHADGWGQLEEDFYFFANRGHFLTGIQRVPYPDWELLPGYGPDEEAAALYCPENPENQQGLIYPDLDSALFVFGEDGVFRRTYSGPYEDEGILRWIDRGQVLWYAGLILDGEDYYCYMPDGMVHDAIVYVSRTNGLLPADWFHFLEDGRLDMRCGLTEEDGELCYYEYGVKRAKGLVCEDGDYYYIASDLKAVRNARHQVFADKTNGLMPPGWYWFGADGKMFLNGLNEENGTLYYYENGLRTYAGLIELDGFYYYIRSDCSAVVNRSYYVTRTNGLVPVGTYDFDEAGRLIPKNGIYREGEYLFYYIDNVRQINLGLVMLARRRIIYVRSGGDLAVGYYYVSKDNGLLTPGTYLFGEDGYLVIKP